MSTREEWYYFPLTIGDRLTFRTWELLSIKMISKVVDKLSTAALDIEHEQQQKRCIETDIIKRLVQAFLPKFPTELRLPSSLRVMDWVDGDWFYYPIVERNIRLEIASCPWVVGDSFWLRYGCCDNLDPIFEHPSCEGIARVQIVYNDGDEILVDIREKISYDRFCDYFETTSYHGDMDASEFLLYDEGGNFWRRHNGQVVGVDVTFSEGDGDCTDRIIKQVDGTWCYAYSHEEMWFTKAPASVGKSFFSEDRMKAIIQTWIDKGYEIQDRMQGIEY